MTKTLPPYHAKPQNALALFLIVFAMLFAACSGDAIIDVEPEGEGDTGSIPFLGLGKGEGSGGTGSDLPYNAENELITVDGMVFADGGGASGPLGLRFFFGYANRGTPDSVNVGLFVYSDEAFDGSVEAGAFEGQELRFSIDGYDVVVASRNPDGVPLLGDGSRIAAHVLHVEDFSWTTSSGEVIHTAIGSADDVRFILDYDTLEWAFDIDRGQFFINDERVGTARGLKQQPFGFFFLYGGPTRGGLFVVSDHSFSESVEAGVFEGKELRFEINDYRVLVTTEAPALLGEGVQTPAWVLHLPNFIMESPSGNTAGPIFGVSSDLESILNNGQGSTASPRTQHNRRHFISATH